MRKASFSSALGLSLLSLPMAAPAVAEAPDVAVSVSPRSVEAGDDVEVTVEGCDPGQRAQAALAIGPGGVIEDGSADAEGVFSAVLTVPPTTPPGDAPVVGQCQDGSLGTVGSAQTVLTVVARNGGGSSSTDGSSGTGDVSTSCLPPVRVVRSPERQPPQDCSPSG